MEEIPEDIRRAVEIGIPGSTEASAENIYRLAGLLVMAERERCAKVAEEQRARCLAEGDRHQDSIFDFRFAASKAGEIATSIRNPDGYLNSPPAPRAAA